MAKSMEKTPGTTSFEGEHQANDKPVIDWQLYHSNTHKLRLKRHETSQKKNEKTAR